MKKKVLLISMPFASLDRPSLGLSLLGARLAEEGVPCDIQYLNLTFAEYFGADNCRRIAQDIPYTAFAGDWCFTPALYGPNPASDRDYIRDVLVNTWRLSQQDIDLIHQARRCAPLFIDHCLQAVPWEEYQIIGFTSTFEQNIASLALAQRLKTQYPNKIIVFGGANWEDVMGLELHRQFPFVDFACSGEAESSFPELVKRLFAGEAPGSGFWDDIPGLIFRGGARGPSVWNGPPAPRDLDRSPFPDFSPYFDALSRCTASADITPTLVMEASRGCWWGAVSQCTFCGLNGGTLGYRSKSPERVLEEISFLAQKWGLLFIELVDNIVDMKYFDTLLPELAKRSPQLNFFFEVKANLNRRQVRQLKEAGVIRVQPGVESLSDHVLGLMRKGTSALRNIQMLKWCRDYGVGADWNILYGFPGETDEDYRQSLRLLDAARFLGMPHACGPVRMDRFSPFFNRAASFGIINLRPLAPYYYLYPFKSDILARIAYFFHYDYAVAHDPIAMAREVVRYADYWRANPEPGELKAIRGADGRLVLWDTRSDAVQRDITLQGAEREVYEFCDSLRSYQHIVEHLIRLSLWTPEMENRLPSFLREMEQRKLMAGDGKHYLSLALNLEPAA